MPVKSYVRLKFMLNFVNNLSIEFICYKLFNCVNKYDKRIGHAGLGGILKFIGLSRFYSEDDLGSVALSIANTAFPDISSSSMNSLAANYVSFTTKVFKFL